MRTGFKKLIVLTLAFAMVLTGFGFENWNLGSAWAASAGEVTEIGTAEELAALGGKQLTGEYRLTKDIDMSGVSMQPIRSIRDGSFDGGGHKIKNLSISADGNAGLFAELGRDTVIKELILENCNIENTSGSYNGAGAMVGYVAAKGSTIENCGVSGGNVSSTSSGAVYTGGLVGYASEDIILKNCYSTAGVTGSLSYSTRTGGLIGHANGTLENCYARGLVDGKTGNTGGLIGYVSFGTDVTNCYSAASITGEGSRVYAFAGYPNSGKYDGCFYDSEKADGIQANDQSGITAKTTAELKAFPTELGGAFQNDLSTSLNEGYPILKWQNPDAEYAVTLHVQPIDAVVTINGAQQPASETGVYTASGLKSGESCTYEVVQKEDAETDLAAQSGSITVGKSDVTKNIKLIPNEYSLQFNLTPQEAEFMLTDGEGRIVSPAGGTTYSVPNGIYNYTAKLFGYKTDKGSVEINKAGQTKEIHLAKQPEQTVVFKYGALINGEEIQNGSLTVTTGKKTMTAEKDNLTYKLPAGYDYEYTFKSANYAKVTGKLTFTNVNETKNHNIDIPLTPKTAWEGQGDVIEPQQADGVYQISCGAELAWFAEQVNSGKSPLNAVLTKDIDLGGEPWTPIGKKDYGKEFKGTLDGKGHKIKNLCIDSAESYQGLFGTVRDAAIRDLFVSGTVKGGEYTAGLIAKAGADTIVENCIVTANITSTKGYAGGLIGDISGRGVKINQSAHIGTVTGNAYNVGGLIGRIYYKAEVENCYHRGTVANESGNTGGLVGQLNDSGAVIENCYSVGMVTGKSDSNPLIGKKSSGSVKNCYYEGAKGADSLGTGKTTEEMKAPAFVADLGAAFIADMKNPVNEGYPIFAFQDNTPKYEAVFTVNPENADFKVFDAEGTLMSAAGSENGVHRYALKAGKYSYEVSAFGYTAQKKNFEVTEKGVNETVTLDESIKYKLQFDVTPHVPDLRIQVMHNGNSLSVSPDGFYNLPEGEYTWVIKAKGYGKQTGTVQLKKDETVKVTLSESNAWDGESKEEVTPNAQGIYEIGTGSELAWFADQVNAGTGKNYDAVLTDDIDLGENPFTPIGAEIKYSTKPYAGIFDGKDHTISGVNIESSRNYVGLFGALQGTSSKYAEVKNLTVKGTVKSDGSFLGGIAGNAKYAKIVNCHNYTDVTASGSKKEKIGGVVGQIGDYSDKSVLKNCSNHGSIIGTDVENVGGVAGYTDRAEVSACFNAGTVSTKAKVGGVIGNANGATVTDLYNVGSVTGQSGNIGGVIAYAAADVSNVYSAGQVTGGKAVFGMVSSFSGSAKNCYYLDTLPADSNATAKASAELKDLEGALNGDRTGEERAWKTSPSDNNGYPILFWQKTKSPVEDKPLAPVKNAHWKFERQDYIDPATQEVIEADEQSWNCFFKMDPVAMWDEVPYADSYTITLWKEDFVWQELSEVQKAKVMDTSKTSAQRLRYTDESKIIEAMTQQEKEAYSKLVMAVIEAQEDHEAHKAAVAAQQKYLTDILDDGKHNVDLGVYRPEIEKVKQIENVKETKYDFTEEINKGGEYPYYFTVTPVAKEGSGYISGKVPQKMTLAELDAMYRDSLTSCYNHLTKPYNLQWDGTTAKWNGSPNADFYSVIIYAVSGTESKPVYKKIRYELVPPEQMQMDCGNIFTVDGKYAFAVRSETNEDGKIKGFISSGISEYSPIYTVGEAQKPDTDRKDWIPISTAKEWIELANIEDVPAENGSNISKQAIEWGKKYYLTDDIDFSELSAADQAKTKSIGNVNNRFMGTMDGNGFKIKGLTLSNNDAGLFSDIGATGLVCDMTIENANVLFSDNAAVLALNNRGTITDCAVKNCNITADTGAVLGGMVSRNYGKISKCYVEGGSLVSNSKTATGHAGFVGSNEGTGLIESCWTSMNINTQSDYAGGFIGLGYGGIVRNCFALGDVSAGGYSGGFAGRSVYQGNIYENCYAAGKVTVTGEEGNGFIGGNKPNSAFQYDQSEGVTNCYYNVENKDCRPYGAHGRTTDEMKTADFLKALSAGNSAWLQNEGKNDGLPYLNGVKAPEGTAAGDITVEIAVAKYNKSTYNFEKMGEPVSVTMSSNGNTRVVDLMDEAVKQNKMTYSYKTSSAFGRYIHTINGRAVEAPDGWMFTVNDKLSNVSASIATVKDGDKLLWYEGTTENLFKGPLWGDLGTGKEENWVDINTVEDLQKLANTKDGKELAKNYRLGRSLDLNGIEFDGIGSVSAPFTGVFDGQNHVISNVKISRSDDCTGFFNAIKGATVKNLKLKGANISGTSRVGGLVGYAMVELDKNNMSGNEANLIGNCTVTGKVTGTADKNTNTGSTGGLVGENGGAYDKDTLFSIYSAVDKCHADVEVTGKYKTGGLIGDNKGNVTKSYALGNVTGTTTTGGFVGDNDGNIYDCHSEGAVNGNGHTGGFAGYSAGEIKTAYSLGNVTGSEYTGGFAGAVSKADFVISAGTVTVTGQSSAGYNGGFAGVLGGTLAGPENMVTIKDAYGNCTGIDSVIGNSTKFEGETEKEKLSQMKLPDMKATAEKLYEMFGINLPSDLSGEAEKYLDAYAVPTGTEAEGTVSPLKKDATADENVKVTYTVSQEGRDYLTGGETLKLKKANDTAKSMWIDVTLKLSDQNAAYTKRIKVMLPVSEEKRTELMDTIAADYTDSSDLWTIMDMAAYGTLSGKDHKTTEDAKQNALNTGITTAAKENASVSDRAKLEITLRSMGIDTTKLYKANDVKNVNNAGRLAAMDVTSGGYYSAPWVLLADLQGNVKLSDTQKNSLIRLLKDNVGTGLFGYEFAGEHFDDPDTAGAALAALTTYYDSNADAKAIVDKIMKALPEAMNHTGSLGNANADAMVIAGLVAAGYNPEELKTEGGATIVDGLLSHVNVKTNKFTFSGQDNAMATEQGFRALVAAAKYDNISYNIYDYSKTKVSAGHATGEGEIVTPPEPGEDNKDITVKVSIQSDTDSWLSGKTVTVKEGSAVYHAFVKAIEGTGITQEGAEAGYVKSMTYNGKTLAEFSKGPNSGWLYKVNGSLPDVGINSYTVKNGDSILFYYTEDWKEDPNAGGWPNPEQKPVSKDITASVSGSTASVKVPVTDLNQLISDALKNKAEVIDLNIKGADRADKISVELPKASVKNIADKTDAALHINTALGNVTLDRKAMTEAVKAAAGDEITLILEKKAASDAQKAQLGDDAAFTDVKLLSGGKEITDLGTAKITVELPVSDVLAAKTCALAMMDADGKLTKLSGKVVTVNGKKYFRFETSVFGSFVLAEEAKLDAAIKEQNEQPDHSKVIAGVKATTIKAKSELNKHSVKLIWTKSKGYKVDGYQVYRSAKKGGKFKKIGETAKRTYLNSTGLKKGVRYYYKVRGVRRIDENNYYTKWSNIANRKMKADSLDYSVKKISVKAEAAAVKGGAVKVSFRKSGTVKVDGYQVYRADKKNGAYKKIATTKKTTVKNTKNLKKGRTYYYKVRGYHTLEGKKIYTKWSSKVSVKAK